MQTHEVLLGKTRQFRSVFPLRARLGPVAKRVDASHGQLEDGSRLPVGYVRARKLFMILRRTF